MDSLNLGDLKSPDTERRAKAWHELQKLIESGKDLRKYRLYFRSLLWYPLQGVRESAWEHLQVYKTVGVTGIEKAFSSSSDRIKLTAWQHAKEALSLGLVDSGQLSKLTPHFWRLLRSYFPTVRKKAWNLLPTLIEMGIVERNDGSRLIEFLRSKKVGVRILAWSKVRILMERGILDEEQVKQNFQYLVEMTEKDSLASRRAKKILGEFGWT
ncbi:hypothetical protein GWK48_03515 [Metallosphaera tengchongensis]|uniref:DNA alkylation repair protein n=1 Tax=Metallosphaera tengchongensis TaxID=1532350 RepID=A0A6N0NTX9_9CREN|nr:hypothetical protein [Metallosphaera tengchongensis]QKQ99586.1 hypothetical protein GWK48_03515 [Metallosphaera tengchongensis]